MSPTHTDAGAPGALTTTHAAHIDTAPTGDFVTSFDDGGVTNTDDYADYKDVGGVKVATDPS